MSVSNQSRKEKLYRQLREFAVMTLYLWVVLGCFTVYKSVVLRQHHIDFAYHGFALINALALAKVMLIAKDVHLGEHFDDAPLIYPTLFKSGLFAMVLACFKILEEFAIGYFHKKSFHESIADLGGGTWSGILTLTLLLFVMLIPFVAFTELQRVVGEEKLSQIFFHPRTQQSHQ